ncbi:MAG: peptidoglycan DD-metalloendopeptidase family protein [Alphaproteobacteria bacterium]|nr:peptidoglycan DD-metalloendopeptidase family protein [Alphaproteobacteria bacterium]
MNERFFLFVLFAGVLCIPLSAYAKPGEKLQKVEEQLAEKKQEQQALDAAATEANENLEKLRARMIDAVKTLQEKESEQEALEDKLDVLTQEIVDKSKNAAQERHQLSLMLSALMEITSRPPESLFLQDRARTDHIHRNLLLQAVLPRLKEKAEAAARDLSVLYELQAKLEGHQRIVSAARANLQKQKKDLDQMIALRQGFLRRTEKQKQEIAQHLAKLADEARDLRQLMEKVSTPRVRKPAGPVSSIALKWPVSGAVRKNFGDKDADGVVSQGLMLAAPSGAAVVAPAPGKVVFAGPFRGYGIIMILQHDNGYHSFLSGFGRIDAEMGQAVDAGEPLGVLPVKTGTKPELYFEWRRGEKTIDPMGGLTRRG